jgi:hypothetical protein
MVAFDPPRYPWVPVDHPAVVRDRFGPWHLVAQVSKGFGDEQRLDYAEAEKDKHGYPRPELWVATFRTILFAFVIVVN